MGLGGAALSLQCMGQYGAVAPIVSIAGCNSLCSVVDKEVDSEPENPHFTSAKNSSQSSLSNMEVMKLAYFAGLLYRTDH